MAFYEVGEGGALRCEWREECVRKREGAKGKAMVGIVGRKRGRCKASPW
jgi:hypothetical protein